MSLPIVAVVGRPNVGKSTFVNRIAQTSDAIVHEQRGVTRDRSYHRADWNGHEFMLIDTGGIEMGGDDAFQASILNQALVACEEADVVLLMVDGQTGLLADDVEVARILKRSGRPVMLLVNKIDEPLREDQTWEFYQVGLGEPWSISSLHGHGSGDLLDALADLLPADDTIAPTNTITPAEPSGLVSPGTPADPGEICVAIIGRPNAGKSTLTNRLLGQERSIVSEVAGTTRDAIDSVLVRDGQHYRIIDTAGIRRKSHIDADVEYYGFVRALKAIDRADVALLLIDAVLGLTDQDQRVARLAEERGCALIILINKWDQLDTPEARELVNQQVEDRLPFVAYAPVIHISALTGRSVHRIWQAIKLVYANYCGKIKTSRLNALLTELRDFGHTISKGRMRLRINYVTQTGFKPPVFTFFANHPQIIDDNFTRYLENRMRESLPLQGTPIKLKFKQKD
ncbi:MAG: ribosome biogenesis GTPase Der [Coriobacteriales bacterium]|jgi:GTP-binding protein|nr:ribosome biogenesis GTPase Der [Coriobacteriales bacterium]